MSQKFVVTQLKRNNRKNVKMFFFLYIYLHLKVRKLKKGKGIAFLQVFGFVFAVAEFIL